MKFWRRRGAADLQAETPEDDPFSDGGGFTGGVGPVVFPESEGEVFTAGEPSDPGALPDPIGDSLLCPLPIFNPDAPLHPHWDGPAIIAGSPLDRVRQEYGDLDEDGIREILNTWELTDEKRAELEAALREAVLINNQDLTGLGDGDGDGGGDGDGDGDGGGEFVD
jgi:hypothetical protein